MNLTGGLRRLGAAGDGPGADLRFAGGQVGDEAQQVVAGLDQAVQTGLFEAQLLEEHHLVLLGHVGDFLLQTGTDRHNLGVFLPGNLQNLVIERVGIQLAVEVILAHVGHIDDRLVGEQRDVGHDGFFLVGELHAAGRLALLQVRLDAVEQIHLGQIFFIALGGLDRLVDAAFEDVQVGEDQLQVDDLDVALGADAALDVDDLAVLKAAHHMDDGVHLTDIGEEFVAQALALGSALDQAGDIHKLDDRRGDLVRVVHLGQLVQTVIRDSDGADVGLDGAEGVVGRLCAGVGDGVEKGALADVRQTHDA